MYTSHDESRWVSSEQHVSDWLTDTVDRFDSRPLPVLFFLCLVLLPVFLVLCGRYTEGGFRVSPWLELLDMTKWAVPSAGTAITPSE